MNVVTVVTNGLKGFSVFFSIILIVELVRYLFGISPSFNIEAMDVYTSFIGIIFFIVISLTKNIAIK